MKRSIDEVTTLVIKDNNDLKNNIANYMVDRKFRSKFPIGTWDVSRVTNMDFLFKGKRTFNESLNNWDTSNVTSMIQMFKGCERFNQPLNNWDTSNVRNMGMMFANCSSFNQPLDNWNTRNVTNMADMFAGAENFNQPLDNWDTSRVNNMEEMFYDCYSFNQPLNNWNTRNVITMDSMFYDASHFNQPLDNWDVSNCDDFTYMFNNSEETEYAFIQDISNWRINETARESTEEMFHNDFPDIFKPLAFRPRQPLRFRNQATAPVAPGRGIAFQVHNKFDKLNIPALVNLIKSGPDLDVYTGANLNQEWLAELRGLAENSGIPELSTKLSRISGKIAGIDFAKPIHNLNGDSLFYTVLNFVKRQPKAYQDNYVNFLVEDSCNAYSAGDTTSCLQGIKERMILALGQAGYNLDTELYKQISSILFQVSDSQIYSFISACLETMKADLVGKSLDEKKQSLLNCVNGKLAISGEMGVNSKIMELIGQSEDMLDDDALTGGKRSRRRRTRKTKKKIKNKRKGYNKRRKSRKLTKN